MEPDRVCFRRNDRQVALDLSGGVLDLLLFHPELVIGESGSGNELQGDVRFRRAPGELNRRGRYHRQRQCCEKIRLNSVERGEALYQREALRTLEPR